MTVTLKPQPGPQTEFCRSSASVVFFGGSAGGGKSYALLLELARYITVKNYSAMFFRKTYPQIKNAGGLWDTAVALYSQLPGAVIRESALTIEWPAYGSKITFSHLQHEQDKLQHQGAQYPAIGFDEVTHFTQSQFMYLFSRNRLGLCEPKLRPFIRATCNPEPGWVRDFLAPWVDPKFPIPAKSGEVRYFFVRGDNVIWVEPDALELTGDPVKDPKSATFIRSSIYDNKLLLQNDPEYLTNLASLNAVERARLLDGRWDVEDGDRVFDRAWFPKATPDELPTKWRRKVRYWDLAGTAETEKNGYRACWTAGVLLGQDEQGRVWVLDVVRFRESPANVQDRIARVAAEDGVEVEIVVEQEPGASGKFVIESYQRRLAAYKFAGDRPTGEKTARWGPFATHAKAGMVRLLKAPWNEAFLAEVEDAPFGAYKDQVDAAAGGYAIVTSRRPFAFV